MAKSLRSKIKRAHRTQLRKTYSEPLIKKKQLTVSGKLHKDIDLRKGGSLAKLAASVAAQEAKEAGMEEESGSDDEEEESKKEEPIKSLPFSEPKGGSLQAIKGFGRQGAKKNDSAQTIIMRRVKDKVVREKLAAEKEEKKKEVVVKETKGKGKGKKESPKTFEWFK
jgi:hypothetical protein